METKDNSTKRVRNLISYQWNEYFTKYKQQILFIWHGNTIQVNIRAVWIGKSREVHYDFYINGMHTTYMFGWNYYGGGSNGKIPEFENNGYKLIIKAGRFSFSIDEKQTVEHENPNLPSDVIDSSVPMDKTEIESIESFNNRKKDTWFSVDQNLQIKKCHKPDTDENLVLWIKKSFYYQYSSDVLLFKYEFFTPKMSSTNLTSGSFSCTRIYDGYKTIESDSFEYLSFEISDETGVCRTFTYERKSINDVLRIHTYLPFLKRYKNWKEYDQLQALNKSNGMSDEEIDNLLTKEISDLGIVREDV